MSNFRGKTALVTGAAGGIGAAIVKQLRSEGVRVAVADRDVAGIAAEAHLPGDLLNKTYADGLPGAASAALGGLDIVVNNAGVITRGSVTSTTDGDWALSLGVNVEATFRVSRSAIAIMAEIVLALRGLVLGRHGLENQAEADLDAAARLDPVAPEIWKVRAQ